jgi:hypothetical protein
MVKWRLPLDLTRQIGLETALKDFLIVDWRGTMEERSSDCGIWKIGKSGAVFLVPPQPRVLESNREHSWTQRIE